MPATRRVEGPEEMRILLTGAAGFIGRHLLAGLADDRGQNTVLAVTRQVPRCASTFAHWATTDLSLCNWTARLPDNDVDIIVHLAQSKHYREFPAQTTDIFDVNVKATVELAQWAGKHRVKRFMFASTGNVYGSKDRTHREEDLCQPDSMYGASKLSAEILLRPFSQFYDVVVLRLFGVYGPGQTNAMLPGMIQRFIHGDEISLAGNIGVRFNPIFVDDCVAVLRQLAVGNLASSYETINVGGPEVVDLRQVTTHLESISGRQASVRITSEVPKQLVGSIDKLHTLIGPRDMVSFREGIRKVFASMDMEERGQG
jgi:nucleoside-diphosphate-sugar epimerase